MKLLLSSLILIMSFSFSRASFYEPVSVQLHPELPKDSQQELNLQIKRSVYNILHGIGYTGTSYFGQSLSTYTDIWFWLGVCIRALIMLVRGAAYTVLWILE